MLPVSHKITIGTATYTSDGKTGLLDLLMKAALAVPVNTCRLVLGSPEALKIALDDSVSIELGYGKDLTVIFTGTVSSVEWSIDKVSIQAASSFRTLAAVRFNLLYERSNAGDIVKDVLARLKLPVGKVESGIQFPSYALGDHQTAYTHLQTLAQKCGCDFYGDIKDKAVFAKYKPAATHEFKYGSNILAFDLDEQTASVTGVEVYGESPASGSQGAEATSWLTKKEVKGTAGTTSGAIARIFDPTVRTKNAAASIAEASLKSYHQKRRGFMKVLGTPNVKLTDAVKVSQMPVAQHNGTFKVTGIGHTVNVRKGFVTVINWEET